MDELGPYELIEVIGRGGMGLVWRARDTRYGRIVALKVIAEDKAQETDYVTMFRREGNLTARLNSSHIIPIHNYGEVRGQAYLEMKYVDGSSLSNVVRTYGAMSLDTALDFIEQAASALDDAHQSGVVHRDVKPGNLLIDKKGFVYLADFGIAAVDRQPPPKSGQVLGSWPYMAPERFSSSVQTEASIDIYALACVLYFALTGQAPFPGRDFEPLRHAHRHTPPPSLMGRVPGMTPNVDGAIRWALAKEPAARPASAGQWIRAVKKERRLSGAPSPLPPTGAQPVMAAYVPPTTHTGDHTATTASSGMSTMLLALLFVLIVLAGALAAVIVHGQ